MMKIITRDRRRCYQYCIDAREGRLEGILMLEMEVEETRVVGEE